jgi:hypothetical protein
MRDEVRLVYWTLGVPKASVKFPLLCRPRHLVGIEIVIAFDDANLGCEFAELGPTSNFRRDLNIIFDILGSSR